MASDACPSRPFDLFAPRVICNGVGGITVREARNFGHRAYNRSGGGRGRTGGGSQSGAQTRTKSGGVTATETHSTAAAVGTRTGSVSGFAAARRESGSNSGTQTEAEAGKKGRRETQEEIATQTAPQAEAAEKGRIRIGFEIRGKVGEAEEAQKREAGKEDVRTGNYRGFEKTERRPAQTSGQTACAACRLRNAKRQRCGAETNRTLLESTGGGAQGGGIDRGVAIGRKSRRVGAIGRCKWWRAVERQPLFSRGGGKRHKSGIKSAVPDAEIAT